MLQDCLRSEEKKVGDSLLRETEDPIRQPDSICWDMLCLPEALVRVITRELPSLIHPSDYYPLLIVQAGSNERSLSALKMDLRRLGWLVERVRVQVVFSCIPSMARKDTERTWKTHLINTYLRVWCQCSAFSVIG